MRLKPVLFFLVVGGVVAFLIMRQSQNGPIRIGQLAPDFTAKDANGKEVRLSDFRGKLVFLNFWASWCAPCEAEMPDLEMMNNSYKNRPFEMMTVSVDVNENDARKFYERKKLTIPWYWDPGRQVSDRFNVTVFPETFIIDRNGHIIKHWPGPVNTQIMNQIESFLRDQETTDQS